MGYLVYIDRPDKPREVQGHADGQVMLTHVAHALLDPIVEISIEPAHECDNCDGDGNGRNTGWPHTTCPVCEGYGWAPGEAP